MNWKILLIITTTAFLVGFIFSFLIFSHPRKAIRDGMIQTRQISEKVKNALDKDKLFAKTMERKARMLQTIPLEGVVNDVLPPFRILSDTNRPKVIKRVDPIYPEEAIKVSIQGRVHLEVQTDIFGRVIKVNVGKPVDSRLYLAAKEAVQKWVFEPVIINYRPREAIFTICFRLKS